MDNMIFGFPLYWYFNIGQLIIYQAIWAYIGCCFMGNAAGTLLKKKHYAIFLSCCLLVMWTDMRLQLTGNITLGLLFCAAYGYLKLLLKQSHSAAIVIALLVVLFQGLAGGIASPVDHFLFQEPAGFVKQQIFMALSFIVYLGVNWGLCHLAAQKIDFPSLQLERRVFAVVLPILLIILSWQTVQAQVMVKTDAAGTEKIFSQTAIEEAQIFLFSGIAYICILSVLLALQKMVVHYRVENERAILVQQLSAQRNYVAEAKLHIRQTRAFRHDLQNHLGILRQLLEAEDIEAAKAYVEKFSLAAADLSFAYHTGSAALDALFNQKLNLASREGIRVECAVMLPKELPVDDFDLCIIFANAIDNAINACRNVKDKYILLSTKRNGNFLLIEVKNSCDPAKKQTGGSGIGIPNIQAAVRKYQGIVEINAAEYCYCLTILLVAVHQENVETGKVMEQK